MSAKVGVAHTHILLLALHLAGPFGPRPQMLLRTAWIAEPDCRLLNTNWNNRKVATVVKIVVTPHGSLILEVLEGRAGNVLEQVRK